MRQSGEREGGPGAEQPRKRQWETEAERMMDA